jgi:hypothetical protein
MKNSTNSTESKTDSTQVNAQTQEAPKTTETETHDDFGYEVEKTEEPVKKSEEPAKKEEPKKEEKSEKVLTGYGDDEPAKEEPKKEEPPKEEKKPEDMTDEEKAAKEISEVVKSLGDEFDKEKIQKFAIENKMTKDQVSAYVKLTNDEAKAAKEAQDKFIKEQRKTWKKELQEDPEFGGEHFDLNVDRVEKLLVSQMPNTKKILTERGSMMPPYIMKDLLSLAKALNPKTNFVGGEPSEPKKEEGNFLDDLYS